MTRRHVLIVGATLALLMLLVPPWQEPKRFAGQFIGWRPVLRPPTVYVRKAEASMPAGRLSEPDWVDVEPMPAEIAWDVLSTQWLALLVIVSGAWLLLRPTRSAVTQSRAVRASAVEMSPVPPGPPQLPNARVASGSRAPTVAGSARDEPGGVPAAGGQGSSATAMTQVRPGGLETTLKSEIPPPTSQQVPNAEVATYPAGQRPWRLERKLRWVRIWVVVCYLQLLVLGCLRVAGIIVGVQAAGPGGSDRNDTGLIVTGILLFIAEKRRRALVEECNTWRALVALPPIARGWSRLVSGSLLATLLLVVAFLTWMAVTIAEREHVTEQLQAYQNELASISNQVSALSGDTETWEGKVRHATELRPLLARSRDVIRRLLALFHSEQDKGIPAESREAARRVIRVYEALEPAHTAWLAETDAIMTCAGLASNEREECVTTNVAPLEAGRVAAFERAVAIQKQRGSPVPETH